MTLHASGSPAAPAGTRLESRARSYARLGKLDVYDYYLSILVATSAVLVSDVDIRTAPMLVLFLLGEIATVVALVALDDVTGYRDGSDIANYGPDDPLRKKLRKPLVAGTLTEKQALRFAWSTAGAGAVLWAASLAVAPYAPLWTVAMMAATYVIALQYSYGLKLSYHGLQEAFLVALGAVLVLAPHALATGRFSGFLLVQAVLFGIGVLMFGVYSNTNDVDGDRAVRRPTVAALTSERGNALFIGALSGSEFLIGVVASATGVAPWWFAVLMLPATALRARQYDLGFRCSDIMRARRLGFTAHRTSVALLVLANLLAGLAGAAA